MTNHIHIASMAAGRDMRQQHKTLQQAVNYGFAARRKISADVLVSGVEDHAHLMTCDKK